MQYIGIQTQISRNNIRSVLLLLSFPSLLLVLTYLFFNIVYSNENDENTNKMFFSAAPLIMLFVAVWFAIAWFSHTAMIAKATDSKPLERQEGKRVYNLVENLCISRGLKTPKIYIINDDSLNAFASGINDDTYAISLSKGIINKLDDEELEGVIAHELTHIINRDVRLLIISIIFVGIFSFIAEFAMRSISFSNNSRDKNKGAGNAMIVIAVLAFAGYLLSIFFRLALSRKREYLADAGAVQLTKKPLALANALRKVSGDPFIEAVKREDVAQMFIEHPQKDKSFFSSISALFATHPPIEDRIKMLEQF